MDIRHSLAQAVQHLSHGRSREAIAACEAILVVDPNNAAAIHTLGLALHRDGATARSIDMLRRAIRLAPQVPDFHNNLGCVLNDLGHLEEAHACFLRTLAVAPSHAGARRNHAGHLQRQGRLSEALREIDGLIREHPSFSDAHASRGSILQAGGRYMGALEAYRRAIALQPNHLFARRGISACLDATGQTQELIQHVRETIRMFPDSAADRSELIQLLHYDSACSAAAICREAQRYAHTHANPGTSRLSTHVNDPNAWRRLRIGYISPDFRDHPLGRLFEPILQSHDRNAFEVLCYSDCPEADPVTQSLCSLADSWRDICRQPDADVAARIVADRIDILIELAGHFPNNRLRMLCSKPAPVQITAIAYMGTTGLPAIDYRISDMYSDPPGMTEGQSSERLVRLPHCAFCYPSPAEAPPIGPLPANRVGYITFGSLNRLCKISDVALQCWAKILASVEESRLSLPISTDDGSHFVQRCERFGIRAGRLNLLGRMSMAEYFRSYNAIDIGLDPFPFNGSVTTCDMLWMGVPVIALEGNSFASRRSLSHLRNIGLDELVARSVQEYVQKAVALARDGERLSVLRQSLRERMARSPLMNAPLFTKELEAAYRDVWGSWCAIQAGAALRKC